MGVFCCANLIRPCPSGPLPTKACSIRQSNSGSARVSEDPGDDQRHESGQCTAGGGGVRAADDGRPPAPQVSLILWCQAEQSLKNYHFDLLFLGVDGIDLVRGVSTHHEDEARLNSCMCQVAERIIVVTDSSKFDQRSLHKIIDTPRIHTSIIDDAVPADILAGLRPAGIDVMLVPAG